MSLSILHCDDDPKKARIVELALKERGYVDYHYAPNGKIGYELASKNKYDIIIADYDMPEMNGREMLSRLRQKGVKTFAILFTAKDIDKDKNFDFIFKKDDGVSDLVKVIKGLEVKNE